MNVTTTSTPDLVREFAALSALMVIGKGNLTAYNVVVKELVKRGVLD